MSADIRRRDNVVFGTGGGRDLRCDIYEPMTGSAHHAAVLMIHGGAWVRGDKSIMQAQAEYLVRRGYVCMSAEYRLTPESPWPAQIHDVKAALRWLRAHAKDLSVDVDKIAVMGNSAGAYLSLMLAATPGMAEFEGTGGSPGISSSVAACIALYPPVLFFSGDLRTSGAVPASSLMGEGATESMAVAASVTTYAHRDFPPTFLQHGTGDKVVPVTASLRMYEALAKARARVDIHLYAEQPHGWARTPQWIEHTMAEATVFLDRYVANPEHWRNA
jgi:acetyl esterase/lipase